MSIEDRVQRLEQQIAQLVRGNAGVNGLAALTRVGQDLEVIGNFKRNVAGVAYTGGIYVPLTAPLTSTAWDGDAHSTTAKTLIDLSAVFGAPDGIKAVHVHLMARDSASEASNVYVVLSPNDSNFGPSVLYLSGAPNDQQLSVSNIVPCDANGDIYYQVVASGAGTLDIWLTIWGYVL